MKLKVVDEKGHPTNEPYILKLPGWTEERYYKEAPTEGKCEFVRGELIMFAPMTREHSEIVGFLNSLLGMYCDAKKLGLVLVGPTIRLKPGVNREPDICFIPKEKEPQAKGIIEVVPSFIIEVSYTTQREDLGEKALDCQLPRPEGRSL